MTDSQREAKLAGAARHHLRNTLQNITAYLNIIMGERAALAGSDMSKAVRYIRTLGHLDDLAAQSHFGGNSETQVSVGQLISTLAPLQNGPLPADAAQLGSAALSLTRATSLMLVLHELLDNAFRHGSGDVRLRAGLTDSNVVVIAVFNSISTELAQPSVIQPGVALRLIERMLKAQPQGGFSIKCLQNAVTARLQFSLLE